MEEKILFQFYAAAKKLIGFKSISTAEMETKERLQFQPPHTITEIEKQFLDTRDAREKELHRLAQQMLGSSYFTGKTHGFNQWLKTNQASQTQGAK